MSPVETGLVTKTNCLWENRCI